MTEQLSHVGVVTIVLFIPFLILVGCFIMGYCAWRKEQKNLDMLDEFKHMGDKPMRYDVLPLSKCESDTTVWVEFLDCGDESKRRLTSLGIKESACLKVVEVSESGTRLRTPDNIAVKLGPISADMVLVRVMKEDGRWEYKL